MRHERGCFATQLDEYQLRQFLGRIRITPCFTQCRCLNHGQVAIDQLRKSGEVSQDGLEMLSALFGTMPPEHPPGPWDDGSREQARPPGKDLQPVPTESLPEPI